MNVDAEGVNCARMRKHGRTLTDPVLIKYDTGIIRRV
jgi:hypothetical protein